MQYVYFCPNCNNLECYTAMDSIINCSECGNKLIPLKTDMDTWNELSNDEMISIIDKAKNNGLKKPVFNTEPKNKGKKKKIKLLLPLITLVVIVVIVTIVIILQNKSGVDESIADKIEETVKSQETVTLTQDNFLDYFDVNVTCGAKEQEHSSRDILGFYSYDFSSDMTVTVKAKKPLKCDNCYLSIDANVRNIGNYTIQDDVIDNIKLDEDGYYTNTKKIHMNGYPFPTFEFYVYNSDVEVKNVSGTISYEQGLFDTISSNSTQESE